MAKRKLSRQQAWRVEKIQAERAKRAARRGADAEHTLLEGELGPEQEGLIVAHYGTQQESSRKHDDTPHDRCSSGCSMGTRIENRQMHRKSHSESPPNTT